MDNVNLFYSWQSEKKNPTIKHALEKAKKDLFANNINLNIEMATSNMTGSPDIMKAIYEKIDNCDFMVSDISIVIFDEEKDKGYCNSNVMLEFGYAVSKLGVDRIITTFNTNTGNPKLLPFDIRNHRFTPFINDTKNSTNNIDKISNIVVDTIVKFKNDCNLKRPTVPKEFLQMEITEFYVYKKELLISFSKIRSLARKINNDFDYNNINSFTRLVPEFVDNYESTVNLFEAFKKDLGKNVNFQSIIESYQGFVDCLNSFKAMVNTALEAFGSYPNLKPLTGEQIKNSFIGLFNDLYFAFEKI